MIFLTGSNDKNKVEVVIYESLEQLADMVEWQDILDESCSIIDEQGNLYAWDDSKKSEYGTIYNYSFKKIGTNILLANQCTSEFERRGRPDEFELD